MNPLPISTQNACVTDFNPDTELSPNICSYLTELFEECKDVEQLIDQVKTQMTSIRCQSIHMFRHILQTYANKAGTPDIKCDLIESYEFALATSPRVRVPYFTIRFLRRLTLYFYSLANTTIFIL
jgi:hypothetical protein